MTLFFFFFWSILLRLLLLTSMYYYLGYNYVGTEVGPAEGPLGTPEVGGGVHAVTYLNFGFLFFKVNKLH